MAAFNDEQIIYNRELNQITDWWGKPRFSHVSRPYKPEYIVARRSRAITEFPSLQQSKLLWDLLQRHHRSRTYTLSYAAVDALQGLEMSPYLETVYLSGELTSSTISGVSQSSSMEVEKMVHEVFSGQVYQDKLQREIRFPLSSKQRNECPMKDYLSPIIAKAGFGLNGSSLLNHCQNLIKNGAGGIIISDRNNDDQVHVLIPVSEHIRRITSLRSLCDTLGTETIIISGITSEKARFITSNIDKRDHPYIIGATNPTIRPLVTIIEEAIKEGKFGIELHAIREKWIDEAGLCTYGDAVANYLRSSPCHNNETYLTRWLAQVPHLSYYEAKELAKSMNADIFWDCDVPRTEEGYYRITGGIEMTIARAKAFINLSDCLSLELSKPCLKEAQKLSSEILCQYPHTLLGYSLSHNWECTSENQIRSFSIELGKMGFVWQCLEYAGAHTVALASESFSRDFAQRGVLAYTKTILPHLNSKIKSITEESDHLYAFNVTKTESMAEDKVKRPYQPKFHHTVSGYISPYQKAYNFYSMSSHGNTTLNMSPIQSALPNFNFEPHYYSHHDPAVAAYRSSPSEYQPGGCPTTTTKSHQVKVDQEYRTMPSPNLKPDSTGKNSPGCYSI